ncbi:MAG: hypothetical protein JJT95_11730 [Pararhodobacter sp.]|nr:hypothetical protein [Pararhodobacter sp.]
MFTKSSTMIAAAAALLAPLALATPLSAQATQFRGGGHISNFQNCQGWGPNSNSITARAGIFEEGSTYSIFSPSFAASWRNFGEPDGDGWQSAEAAYAFASFFTTENQIRIISMFPPEPDEGTDIINVHAEVNGFSGQPDCTAEIRLLLRQQSN